MRKLTLGPGPVAVPHAALKGLEAVRRSGLTNMLDRPRVAKLADFFGFEEAASWVEANRAAFAQGMFLAPGMCPPRSAPS